MPPRQQQGPRIAPQPSQGAGAGPQIRSHVTTIGVRRSAWGTAGRAVTVSTNHFEVKIPQNVIHHYDVIGPSDKNLPARLNLEIIKELQNSVPDVFQPKAVYDGRKNMFSIRALPFPNGTSQDFKVSLVPAGNGSAKEYKVRLTKVAEINPELLSGFLQGRQSHDNAVLTAITALNVVIRMEPISKYPFNVRSFFTNREQKDIGGGIALWRGYFQSIRPGGNRMWINIDISTGTMYKEGPLISLCLSHLGRSQPQDLSAQGGFNQRDKLRLQRFLSGLRIHTIHTTGQALRVIKKVSDRSAAQITFQTRDQGTITVANYFMQTYRRALQYPQLPCVEVGSGALIPLELCVVPAGQIMRKQVPPEKTRDVLAFSTQKPPDRLNSIRNGIQVFEYNTSEYLKSFGMSVITNVGPHNIPARILIPPTLMYGGTAKQRSVRPDNGQWNMRDKKFYVSGSVGNSGWMMVVFERQQRFNQQVAQGVIDSLVTACRDVGINGLNDSPYVTYLNPQAPIRPQLMTAGGEFKQKLGRGQHFPGLIVAILPENASDLYTAIKYFGDCVAGVPTQCLKALKCSRGNAQYFANVCLKLNVKLGGINCVPMSQDVPFLTDPTQPALVFGADVIHPPPGSEGRPSFTALVGNVDPENSKYVAKCSVQESRQEIIQDLKSMAESIITMNLQYHRRVHNSGAYPRRILYFRDGVSEGQFQKVLDDEVPQLKAACAEIVRAGITPKLTVVVVGKRHHVRFFPTTNNKQDMDNSGNCRAGTVVDRDISHPTEFDYYLQSHAGLLGTSRPAHYNVLLDENNFSPDALQQLSFALCHVYARSTRSVSIPAPVYYADIVCSRAKNHFDPQGSVELDSTSNTEQSVDITAYKKAFKPIHNLTGQTMYFS